MAVAEERILSLWHALDTTKVGRSKADIRRIVPGYGDLQGEDAFERMFSRDKAALRIAGVEVETRLTGAGEERYLLAKTQLRPVVDLSPAELGAVRLAAGLWQSGELSRVANGAARMLAGNVGHLSSASAELSFAAPIPFIPVHSDLFNPLMTAITNRQRVTLNYRNATSGKFRKRHIEPWRLAFRDGGWYLLGRDTDLAQARAFRLSRMTGNIKLTGPRNAYPPNPNVNVGELLGETGHAITATLAVRPGRAARLRAAGSLVTPETDSTNAQQGHLPTEFDLLKYRYQDEREFADELAGLGEDVIVIGPPQLKSAVLARLHSAAQLVETLNAAQKD